MRFFNLLLTLLFLLRKGEDTEGRGVAPLAFAVLTFPDNDFKSFNVL